MEAVKTKGVARNGILSVPVPKQFEDKELEVIILSADLIKTEETGTEVSKHDEKVERLMGIVGAAKFPETPLTKYDVYHQ